MNVKLDEPENLRVANVKNQHRGAECNYEVQLSGVQITCTF